MEQYINIYYTLFADRNDFQQFVVDDDSDNEPPMRQRAMTTPTMRGRKAKAHTLAIATYTHTQMQGVCGKMKRAPNRRLNQYAGTQIADFPDSLSPNKTTSHSMHETQSTQCSCHAGAVFPYTPCTENAQISSTDSPLAKYTSHQRLFGLLSLPCSAPWWMLRGCVFVYVSMCSYICSACAETWKFLSMKTHARVLACVQHKYTRALQQR